MIQLIEWRCRACACAMLVALGLAAFLGPPVAFAQDRPNILWISSEDNGPDLGCYGDAYATTPNLDALARRGMIYRNVWAAAPVCAPSRTAIISGMVPASTGSEHMRSLVRLPEGMAFFPQLLRNEGYYCTNNSKEDYNLDPGAPVWDESSTKAHWKNRGAGQPFFAVFNSIVSHESRLRGQSRPLVHDPAKVHVPGYHPDTLEVRADWARYYDNLTLMDAELGGRLDEIEAAGLAGDTIIVYFGDHGSGMPRHKRMAMNTGLGVPLIVYFPEKYRHLAPREYTAGGSSDRLVGFVDFAPTALRLAGIEPPAYYQGRVFAGVGETPAPEYVFGSRARMDERLDLVRAARDERYVYVRNFMPHRPHGQFIAYQFMTPTTAVWSALYKEGKLTPAQAYFWGPKAPEELYDLENDPEELTNLATNASHAETLARFRRVLDAQMIETRDVSFVPEPELRRVRAEITPYDYGHDDARYPMQRVLDTAHAASMGSPERTADLVASLGDANAAVRYWAVLGLFMRGESAVIAQRDRLRAMFSDESPAVRIAAAEAMAAHASGADAKTATELLIELANIERDDVTAAVMALNALDYLDAKAAPYAAQIAALPATDTHLDERYRSYAKNLIQRIATSMGPH